MKRSSLALAAFVVGASAPLGMGSPATADDPAFSGFSATTVATPLMIEVFEPTIPIPASPQAEVKFGYTRVIADSSSSRSRASFLWPGDAAGEGAKTILDNLGLPPELVGPIAAQGYPVQVNAAHPSGPDKQYQQPFPGTVMHAKAGAERTIAQNGYSSKCDLDTSGDAEGDGGGGGGLPELPELPLSGLGIVDQLVAAVTGGSAESSRTKANGHRSKTGSGQADEAEECQIPAELAALVSFGGYEAVSINDASADEVRAQSRAAAGGISLIGGLITVSGVSAKAVATSDGAKPVGAGSAAYGTLAVAGQEFTLGPEGAEGGGQSQPIPGLPDDPKKALAELGVTITVPEPVYEIDGQEAKSTVEALVVEIDSKTLAAALKQLPLEDIIGQLPEDMKDLKKVLQAGVNLSPRFVVHLGHSTAKVETVQPFEIPANVPSNDPGVTEEETGPGGSKSGGSSGGLTTGGTTAPPPATTGTGSTDGALTDAALASGLPPLFSIPTLLVLAALGGAVVAGSYVRRVGALALGGGGACSHGLDSGLPDLRRIQ